MTQDDARQTRLRANRATALQILSDKAARAGSVDAKAAYALARTLAETFFNALDALCAELPDDFSESQKISVFVELVAPVAAGGAAAAAISCLTDDFRGAADDFGSAVVATLDDAADAIEALARGPGATSRPQ